MRRGMRSFVNDDTDLGMRGSRILLRQYSSPNNKNSRRRGSNCTMSLKDKQNVVLVHDEITKHIQRELHRRKRCKSASKLLQLSFLLHWDCWLWWCWRCWWAPKRWQIKFLKSHGNNITDTVIPRYTRGLLFLINLIP